jgi:hypothetical protein
VPQECARHGIPSRAEAHARSGHKGDPASPRGVRLAWISHGGVARGRLLWHKRFTHNPLGHLEKTTPCRHTVTHPGSRFSPNPDDPSTLTSPADTSPPTAEPCSWPRSNNAAASSDS